MPKQEQQPPKEIPLHSKRLAELVIKIENATRLNTDRNLIQISETDQEILPIAAGLTDIPGLRSDLDAFVRGALAEADRKNPDHPLGENIYKCIASYYGLGEYTQPLANYREVATAANIKPARVGTILNTQLRNYVGPYGANNTIGKNYLQTIRARAGIKPPGN